MSHSRTMYRLAVAALAITALAAPAATAAPIDPVTGGTVADKRQQNMYASTVHAPAVQKELRSPDARVQPALKAPAVKQELRSPDAITPVPKPAVIPPGMPTWPTNPQTLPSPKAPAVLTTDGDGGGVDWTVPAIALAACLMAGGALAVARTRLRAARTPAH